MGKRSKTCILEIYVANTDAKAYKGLSLRAVLEATARVKNATYLNSCLEQQHTFALLAYLINTMSGVKARTFEKLITSLLAARWKQEYIELVDLVCAKMALARA